MGARGGEATLDEPLTAGRHAGGSRPRGASRQAEADPPVGPAAESPDTDRGLPHRDHAQRSVLRPLSSCRHPADGRPRQMVAHRRRRGSRTARSPSSLDELRTGFPQAEVAAVCQCSGNRRGLSSAACPRRGMGLRRDGQCASGSGPRLKDVLAKAGVEGRRPGGMASTAPMSPVLPTTPDFVKSLPMDKALADETIIAYDDEWSAAAASQRLSRARDRAGMDRDLLDEARHQHPAQQQAARELLGQGGLSHTGGDVRGGSSGSRRKTPRQPGRSPRWW